MSCLTYLPSTVPKSMFKQIYLMPTHLIKGKNMCVKINLIIHLINRLHMEVITILGNYQIILIFLNCSSYARLARFCCSNNR